MTEQLHQEEHLLFQSYFTFALLTELTNANFLKSDYFKAMSFGSPWIKEELENIGIDNQGCALIALYTMLVVPRQLLNSKYSNEYDGIQGFLQTHTQNTVTTYKKDILNIDFLRHVRNSVAHARVEFRPRDVIIFSDSNSKTGEAFKTELPLKHLGEFLQRLQNIHLKHIEHLQKATQL